MSEQQVLPHAVPITEYFGISYEIVNQSVERCKNSVKKLTSSLIGPDTLYWPETREELRDVKLTVDKSLDEMEHKLLRLVSDIRNARNQINKRHVVTEKNLQYEREGYESGITWGDRREYWIPGGPSVRTQYDVTRNYLTSEARIAAQEMAQEEAANVKFYFKGFARGIEERLAKGKTVPHDVKRWLEKYKNDPNNY